MHTLRLKLKTSKMQKRFLNKSFYIAYKMYIVLVKYARKRLSLLSRNKRYLYLKKMYGVYKNEDNKTKLKEVSKELNKIIKDLGVSTYDLEKYIKVQSRKYKNYISSQQAQKIAKFVSSGVDDFLYGNGKKLKIKKYTEFSTISQKSNLNGVRFFKDYILFMNLKIPVIYSKNAKDLDYINKSLANNLSYCELQRIEFNSGYEYYINLVLEGDAPCKIKRGKDTLGIDPGVSTIASVSNNECILKELAPKCKDYNKKIIKLQRCIDKSIRDSNPNCFNDDGTYKKGCRLFYTKHCKYLKRKLRVLYRKKKSYTKCTHNKLANNLLNGVKKVNIEFMDFKALAKKSKETKCSEKISIINNKEVFKYKRKKRFGKSINDRSPGLFIKILETKANRLNIEFNKINTKKVKASKYNHLTNKYENHKLSERTKLIGEYLVQRDLYSAYIIKNVKKDLESLNKQKLKKDFDNFLKMQNICIEDIKKQGIKNKNFGF